MLQPTDETIGRHGDIEDTLLTIMMARVAGGKKFDKMAVARVYFGNWLRDYCMFKRRDDLC
jgi:Heterokaryon incompatibility protein Het-C